MKKIFKGLAILVASTALCAGIATATACSGGYNGTYEGDYHYDNWGHTYGMKVRVTVENNIITKVEDISPENYIVVSDPIEGTGWTTDTVNNWKDNEAWLLQQYKGMAVSDVLDIEVYIKDSGEPYEKVNANNEARNPNLVASGLLISGATQGSGRLLLAVQDALSK